MRCDPFHQAGRRLHKPLSRDQQLRILLVLRRQLLLTKLPRDECHVTMRGRIRIDSQDTLKQRPRFAVVSCARQQHTQLVCRQVVVVAGQQRSLLIRQRLVSRIAKAGKAAVLPWFPRRLPRGAGYVVDIYPVLEDYPTGDMAGDALRINKLLEVQIRKAPEQYYWVHRRFKGRPAPLEDPYQ